MWSAASDSEDSDGGSGVVVRVVAVRYGPYAGVQEGVAVAVCDDEVAVIA